MRKLITALLFILFTGGCAVKPEYLIEDTTIIRSNVITEQQLLEQRRLEMQLQWRLWNWQNRERIRRQLKPQRYRHPQRGIRNNNYNPRAKIRQHIQHRKHNGVKVHPKNYWSKTPSESNHEKTDVSRRTKRHRR